MTLNSVIYNSPPLRHSLYRMFRPTRRVGRNWGLRRGPNVYVVAQARPDAWRTST